MPASCLATIRNNYADLTAAEKRIADYVLRHPEDVADMTVQQLADHASTAKSAVIRFCNSVGFDSYRSLKMAITADLIQNDQLDYQPFIEPGDDIHTITRRVFATTIKSLNSTIALLKEYDLDTLIDRMNAARQIYIIGVGCSATVGSLFQYRLLQAGVSSIILSDNGTMSIATLSMGPEDLVFAISNSGKTKAVVDTARLAHERGATVACITGVMQTPLAKLADFPIIVPVEALAYPLNASSLRTVQIAISDVIAVALSVRNYDASIERMTRVKELLGINYA